MTRYQIARIEPEYLGGRDLREAALRAREQGREVSAARAFTDVLPGAPLHVLWDARARRAGISWGPGASAEWVEAGSLAEAVERWLGRRAGGALRGPLAA